MNTPPQFTRRPATALIAMASALGMGDPIAPDELDEIIRAVVDTPGERLALLAALRVSNDPDSSLAVADLLSDFASRAADAEASARDAEQVIGQWAQRLAAGALLASFGATIAGTVTGALAFGLALLSFAGFIIAAASRIGSRNRIRRSSGLREGAEALARHALEAGKMPGADK